MDDGEESASSAENAQQHHVTFRNLRPSSIITPLETPEGVGAKVLRSIGSSKLRNLDPFLVLDETFAKEPAGFTDLPQRGFGTVSYMLEGTLIYEIAQVTRRPWYIMRDHNKRRTLFLLFGVVLSNV
ncbi:hypothetical protein BJ742DRAFT_774675 [Cladochytrium replicatum]|nr:hypothetical protein BJ742DRAFT_774675 [Cladochytrium replicatum]